MKSLSFIGLMIGVIWIGLSCQKKITISAGQETVPATVDFNFHVRPILADRCYACHGPDVNARQGDLRLDLESAAFAPLDSSAEIYAIVPGDPKRSLLVERILSDDPEHMMPPPESNLTLSTRDVAILQRWIEQGAEWKEHWAYQKPEKPEPPKSHSKWIKNEIDEFVFMRSKGTGLRVNAEATKEKLIRRLSFDLRGLPPSLMEIQSFVEDHSDDAYEQLIDKFLSSPRYGERMAMEWLDLARYADSHGYQDDIERSMWPWRDWIISAFNQNMSYDQFVTWQLAGDLLPNSTYEQTLATAFNRNHKITQEVGVIEEEYRVTYVLDRVNTFSTAFLGMTIECAQCHDHKYDPITQKEYYQLFGFFNNVAEKGRVDYGVEVAEPYLPLPEDRVDALKSYIQHLFEDKKSEHIQYVADKWREGFTTESMMNGLEDVRTQSIPSNLVAWYPLDYLDGDQADEVVNGGKATVINSAIPTIGLYSGGIELMGTNYLQLTPELSFNLNGPFTVSFWIKSIDGGIRGPVLASTTRQGRTSFQLGITNDKSISLSLSGQHEASRMYLVSKKTLPANAWTFVTLRHDGTRRAQGFDLYMDGELLETYVTNDNFRGRILASEIYLGSAKPLSSPSDGKAEDLVKRRSKGLEAGQLDEIMFFNRRLAESEVEDVRSLNPLHHLLDQKTRSKQDLRRLFFHDLTKSDNHYQELLKRLREYKIRLVRTSDIIAKPTMVMADMDTVRPTFVLDRGQYDAPREEVYPGTPQVLGSLPNEYSPNRLGLAHWLFDHDNPLTARVAVNRYWQMIFGKGLVETAGDFGSQGALPSHPALLDWLAVSFIESGWDLKHLLRLMVSSATYRQSVHHSAKTDKHDPDNIYLTRGAAVRLSAEMIRDHALSISGLLDDRIGGPSVKPYQPDGLWLEVASGNQSLRKYIQDHDRDLYRRSLYTFWKRTIPPPSMTIFDAPSREQCLIKRTPTSTPMQALVLLNDPQFVEASRLLALRMRNEAGSIEDQISFGFQLATSRMPTQKESELLVDLYQRENDAFKTRPEAALRFLEVGEYPISLESDPVEVAAFTVVASTILNATESVMKG